MKLRFTDTPCRSVRARRHHDRTEDASTLGPRVASFAGKQHTVHVDDDGDIHVHRLTAATHDKTHSERLKELSAKLAKIWENKS
jgi:hypothetical protein